MTLLNPLGLLGLLSLPAVLLLHLLHERKRRYVVSDLSLWAFLENEARAPRLRRLPITRLLLLDLLIAALLSLAWAQPRLALPLSAAGARHHIVVLDVSTSMRAQDGVTSRIERAKAEVDALLERAGPNDVVTLVGFGERAGLIADSREGGAAGLAEKLAAVQAGETAVSSARALREAIAVGLAAWAPDLPVEFTIVTDGSFSQDDPAWLDAFEHPLRWRLVGGPVDNQAVIAIQAEPLDGERLEVFTRIANFSGRSVVRSASLLVDGREAARAEVAIPADSSVPQVWQVPGPADSVTVALSGSDSLAADDSASAGVQPGGTVRVALVTAAPGVLQQAVQAVPGADLTVLSPQEYHAGSSGAYDLTIFREYLPEQWPDGTALVVEPASNAASDGSSTLLDALAGASSGPVPAGAAVRSPGGSALVEGIDFSGVRWSSAWKLDAVPPGFRVLLQAADAPLLLEGSVDEEVESGRVLILLADLARGSFTKHPAFPILIANILESARQLPLPPSLHTGQPVDLPQPGSYAAVQIALPDHDLVELDGEWPDAWNNTLEPGLYRFRLVGLDGETADLASGINAGSPGESDLRPRTWVEVAAAGGGVNPAAAGSEERPLDLRPWLLGAAILALLVEAVLAWRR